MMNDEVARTRSKTAPCFGRPKAAFYFVLSARKFQSMQPGESDPKGYALLFTVRRRCADWDEQVVVRKCEQLRPV